MRQDERDALGRRVMLSDCEVRGDALVGGRISAFAKRAKKLPISCTFQWIRVLDGGHEVPLPGHDKATYNITPEDRGCRLRVTVIPTVKETNEMGQPVTALSPLIELSDLVQDGVYADDDQSKPRLLDWKIEMNPRKEYSDPIRISYTYAGGGEGATIIQWCREAAPEDGDVGYKSEDGFAPLMVSNARNLEHGTHKKPRIQNPGRHGLHAEQ